MIKQTQKKLFSGCLTWNYDWSEISNYGLEFFLITSLLKSSVIILLIRCNRHTPGSVERVHLVCLLMATPQHDLGSNAKAKASQKITTIHGLQIGFLSMALFWPLNRPLVNKWEREKRERCGIGNKLTHTKNHRFNNQPTDAGSRFGSPCALRPTACLLMHVFK